MRLGRPFKIWKDLHINLSGRTIAMTVLWVELSAATSDADHISEFSAPSHPSITFAPIN
jgi:hypothetical protein